MAQILKLQNLEKRGVQMNLNTETHQKITQIQHYNLLPYNNLSIQYNRHEIKPERFRRGRCEVYNRKLKSSNGDFVSTNITLSQRRMN